jgi:hypothetical protein
MASYLEDSSSDLLLVRRYPVRAHIRPHARKMTQNNSVFIMFGISNVSETKDSVRLNVCVMLQ